MEKLQRSVAEMYQMFVDLATLVEEQGEVLNSIEANVRLGGVCAGDQASAVLMDYRCCCCCCCCFDAIQIDDAGTYIEKANKHLVDAHKKSKKARTCMCCLAIIAVAVLLAIVVPSTISGTCQCVSMDVWVRSSQLCVSTMCAPHSCRSIGVVACVCAALFWFTF